MPYGEPTHGWWCNARTYPTRCKYCGAKVFFFTCDCGSKVFFDELGWPWPEHRCPQYLAARYGKEFIERAMSVQMMLPGAPVKGREIAPDYANVVRQRCEAPRPPSPRIVRCDPGEGQAAHDIGVIREIIAQVDVFKRLDIPHDSAFGIQLLGPLAHDSFGQLTVHTGDLAYEDARSYTFLVSQRLLRKSEIVRGDIVSFELRALSVPGRRGIWLCEGLESPFS